MIRRFSLAQMLVLLLLACCRPLTPRPPDPTTPLKRVLQDYPQVDGSTSTYPLQVSAACALFEAPCEWTQGIPFTAMERVFLPDPARAHPGQDLETILEIRHAGTHTAYVNLIRRKADLILVARRPSRSESLLGAALGAPLEVVPVALDSFVFIVNAGNPIQSLSLSELRAVYSGEITQWSQLAGCQGIVGCPQGMIHPYRRDPNSGSQVLMERLVMKGTPMAEIPNMMLESMIGPINALGQDSSGLGYSVYYYATVIAPSPALRLVPVEGVAPSTATIAEGTYPLTTEVFAVTRRWMPRRSSAVLLRDWLLTAEGQEVVRRSGYAPLR